MSGTREWPVKREMSNRGQTRNSPWKFSIEPFVQCDHFSTIFSTLWIVWKRITCSVFNAIIHLRTHIRFFRRFQCVQDYHLFEVNRTNLLLFLLTIENINFNIVVDNLFAFRIISNYLQQFHTVERLMLFVRIGIRCSNCNLEAYGFEMGKVTARRSFHRQFGNVSYHRMRPRGIS